MSYPVVGRPTKKRYLGNDDPSIMEVHDLHQETAHCCIDEIIDGGHGVVFMPDTLEQAVEEGYGKCASCMSA